MPPSPEPERMTSRIPASAIPPPSVGAPHPLAGAPISDGRPPFSIQIFAADGTLLLELSEQNGQLVARGDESRWDEAAKRFVYGMLQWSGQVGIRWKDEAIKAGEQ